jgi:hypothetical protein
LACFIVSALSVALTAAVQWPTSTGRLVVVTKQFGEPSPPRVDIVVQSFFVFRLCVAAASFGALADSAGLVTQRGRRVAEACAAALGGVAIYFTLGGCTIFNAMLSALLLFTAALSDTPAVLVIALAVTFWDPAFVSGTQRSGRALTAFFYIAYAAAGELTRSRGEDLCAVVTTAGRVTALWQAYAVLSGEAVDGLHESMYLALVLPFMTTLGYVAFDKPTAPLELPTEHRHRKHTKRKQARSFRIAF